MNATSLPEEFRSYTGLGMVQAYHPLRPMNRWGSLLFSLALLAAAAIVLGYGVYEAYIWSVRNGPIMIQDKLPGPAIIAVILFVLSMIIGWSALASWHKSVAVYERGLVARDRKGFQTWRWEDLDSMYTAVTRHYTNGIYTGTSHVYTLVDAQGKRLVLNDAYIHVEDLARLIDLKTMPILYERASNRYNAGEALLFGPVAINKTGLTFGRKSYPWSEVKQVSISRGILKVAKKDGGWFSGASVTVSTIPNLRVLLSIIDQIVGIKAA